jgi:hypothetical protein
MSGKMSGFLRNAVVGLGVCVLWTMTMTGAAQAQLAAQGPFCVTLGAEGPDDPRTIYRFTLVQLESFTGANDIGYNSFSVNGVKYEDEPGVSGFEFAPLSGTMFLRFGDVDPFGQILGGFFRISLTEHIGETFDGSAETVFDFDFTFTGTWFSQYWEGAEVEEEVHSIDGGSAIFLFECPSDNAFPSP